MSFNSVMKYSPLITSISNEERDFLSSVNDILINLGELVHVSEEYPDYDGYRIKVRMHSDDVSSVLDALHSVFPNMRISLIDENRYMLIFPDMIF